MKTFGIYNFSLIILILIINTSSKDTSTYSNKITGRTNNIKVDNLASAETIALSQNLQNISKKGVLFGYQDDTAYGVDCWAESGRSDVKEVCGDYPAGTWAILQRSKTGRRKF